MLRQIITMLYFRFLHDEQYKGRVMMGLRELIWVWLCGYGIKMATRMAWSWWFPKGGR